VLTPYGRIRSASVDRVDGEILSVQSTSRLNLSRLRSSSSLIIVCGRCRRIVAETSTTPGSATAAATRCSKASARGTQ
jgi:hypothetical protein